MNVMSFNYRSYVFVLIQVNNSYLDYLEGNFFFKKGSLTIGLPLT